MCVLLLPEYKPTLSSDYQSRGPYGRGGALGVTSPGYMQCECCNSSSTFHYYLTSIHFIVVGQKFANILFDLQGMPASAWMFEILVNRKNRRD